MNAAAPTLKKVLMLVNLQKEDAKEFRKEVAGFLGSRGIEVDECAFSGKVECAPAGDYDLAITLGGDGTVLYAARCFVEQGTPLFPINLGTLGFIAAIHKDDWTQTFEAYAYGTIQPSVRLMADVKVLRSGRELAFSKALNDAVVTAAGISKIIRLDVGCGGLDLGRYRADGLIVATPTGSTAYSVAAGGPILDPEMDAFIINPVCPFTLSNRPVVIPAGDDIRILVEKEQRSEVILTIDGQVVVPLERGDVISIRRSFKRIPIVASDRAVFYRTLKSKLNWSGGPDA